MALVVATTVPMHTSSARWTSGITATRTTSSDAAIRSSALLTSAGRDSADHTLMFSVIVHLHAGGGDHVEGDGRNALAREAVCERIAKHGRGVSQASLQDVDPMRARRREQRGERAARLGEHVVHMEALEQRV